MKEIKNKFWLITLVMALMTWNLSIKTPVITLTASEEDGNRFGNYSSGGTAFMTKQTGCGDFSATVIAINLFRVFARSPV